MFTTKVRNKLWLDYGIRDIPHELLDYLIRKERSKYEREATKLLDAPTCAFLVANVWQRGKKTPAI